MPRTFRHSQEWGGKRPHAGRPVQSIPCRRLSITLPEDLLHALEQEAHYRSVSRSAVIAQHLYRAIQTRKNGMDHKT